MRKILSLNSTWQFTKDEHTEIVDLPHCWNAID